MSVNCDPNSLMEAARCFRCIPPGMQQEVITYLLCQIAEGGGGGTPNIVTTPPGQDSLFGVTSISSSIPITKLVINATTNADGYFLANFPLLTEVSFPNLVSTQGTSINIETNPVLTTISFPNYVPFNGVSFLFVGNALDATSVEGILRRFVLAGVVACAIDVSGGTNAGLASLSAQGQADAATLGGQLTINP